MTIEVDVEVQLYCDPPDPSVGINGWSFSLEGVKLADGTDAPECIAKLVNEDEAAEALANQED